jgi:hypothetical protein
VRSPLFIAAMPQFCSTLCVAIVVFFVLSARVVQLPMFLRHNPHSAVTPPPRCCECVWHLRGVCAVRVDADGAPGKIWRPGA